MESLNIDKILSTIRLSGDPRSNDYPLVQDPSVAIGAVLVYLGSIYFGKKIMSHREPFQLRSFIVVYNLCLVILTAWMAYEAAVVTIFNENFNLFCHDNDPSDTSGNMMRLVKVLWVFYISKYIELLDTAFFVLRKKNSHITFLQVFHHGTVVLVQWASLKYNPAGVTYLPVLLNCIVHAILYSYYALSALGVNARYLWWKTHLTQLQIIQLVADLVYFAHTFYVGCAFNGMVVVASWVFIFILVILFLNFYIRKYLHFLKKKQ